MLAQRIAQLDQMARGRFYWGVGSGGFPGDFDLFGIDPKSGEHRDLTRQALDLILELWNDPKPGLYESRYWRFRVPEPEEDIALRLHLRPYQRPHPPIAVAGVSSGSETLVLAGERGYIPMSINFVPARILRTHWEGVEAGARRAGRPADRGAWRIARDVYVAETTAQARREALAGPLARDWNGYFLPLLRKTKRLGLPKVDPEMPDAEVTVEYLLDHVWVVGDPDTVAEKLARLRDEVGGFGWLLAIGHEWEPLDAWRRSMTLLREQVLPQL
jgi:alkanesulfonate monooxygenase SsuD/methylene tetrahydromethanopterin reductase-like flavin-dependent oxidoreductase (luciferase family)